MIRNLLILVMVVFATSIAAAPIIDKNRIVTQQLDAPGGNLKLNANLDLNSNDIQGLTTNTSDSDSGLTVGAGDSLYVSQSGDTINGDLRLSNNSIKDIDWNNSDDGAGSNLNADKLDGVELTNVDWINTALARSEVSPSDVGDAGLSTGSSLSGNTYDGTSAQTWDVMG